MLYAGDAAKMLDRAEQLARDRGGTIVIIKILGDSSAVYAFPTSLVYGE